MNERAMFILQLWNPVHKCLNNSPFVQRPSFRNLQNLKENVLLNLPINNVLAFEGKYMIELNNIYHITKIE